jgi:hypothetical protein
MMMSYTRRHGGDAQQPAVNNPVLRCKAPRSNHSPACTVAEKHCSSLCHRHMAAYVLFNPQHQSLPGIHFRSLHMRIIAQLALLTRPSSACCFVSSRGLKTLSCPFGGGTSDACLCVFL